MTTKANLAIKQKNIEIRDRSGLKAVPKRLASKPLLHSQQALTITGQGAKACPQLPEPLDAIGRKLPFTGQRLAGFS